jgi:hypothetical protein
MASTTPFNEIAGAVAYATPAGENGSIQSFGSEQNIIHRRVDMEVVVQ